MALVPRARHQAQSVAPTPVVGVQAAQTGAGHLARGLSNAGDAFQDWQDEIDTADAKAADAQFSDEVRKLLYEDGDGFMSRMGGNAVRERQGVNDLLRDKQEQILGGLSGGARRKAQDAIQGRYQGALQRVDVHTSGQRRTFLNDTANARVKAAVNDAIYDPEKVSESISLVVQEARDAGARNGSSPDVIKGQIVEAQTKIHSGIVKRIAAQSPIDAMRYLQDNKSKMLGSEVASLATQLAPAVKEYKGRQAGRAAFLAGQPSTAFDLISEKEGFRSSTYWDVSHHRVGFGSDTITRADGSVHKVRKGDKVSKADAARDLHRRIAGFQKDIVGRIGKSSWANLDHGTQAALTSVVYNYGDDPKDLKQVYAAAGAGDKEAIARAIEGLAGHNNGVNRGRRMHEASLVRGGNGQSAGAVMRSIIDIVDPAERSAALREFKLQSGAKKATHDAQRDAAADAAFKIIESGGSVDDLPLDFREEIGIEGMSPLRSYQDKVASGEKVETNPKLYVSLSKMASETPDGFTKLNPIAWRDKLDDGDFEKFVDLQRTIRNSGHEEAKKKSVLVDAPTISSLRTASTASLKAAGLDTKSNPKTIAAFERELMQWADTFTRKGNKTPTPLEVNEKINRMLTPVVLDPSGIWNETDRTQEKPAFQIDYDGNALDPDDDMTLADVHSASIKINGQDVDSDLLDRFVGGFTVAMGRNPTAQEVIDGLIESGAFQ